MKKIASYFKYTGNLEVPCNLNVSSLIEEYCLKNNITIISLIITPVKRDFLDKILFIKRENISFVFSSDKLIELKKLQKLFQDLENE